MIGRQFALVLVLVLAPGIGSLRPGRWVGWICGRDQRPISRLSVRNTVISEVLASVGELSKLVDDSDPSAIYLANAHSRRMSSDCLQTLVGAHGARPGPSLFK